MVILEAILAIRPNSNNKGLHYLFVLEPKSANSLFKHKKSRRHSAPTDFLMMLASKSPSYDDEKYGNKKDSQKRSG